MNIQQEKEECAFVAAAFFSCSSLFLLKFITKLLQGLQRCRELKIVSLFLLGTFSQLKNTIKLNGRRTEKTGVVRHAKLLFEVKLFWYLKLQPFSPEFVVFCSQNDQMQIDLNVDANGMPLISEFRCYLISLPAGSFLCGKIFRTKWTEV